MSNDKQAGVWPLKQESVALKQSIGALGGGPNTASTPPLPPGFKPTDLDEVMAGLARLENKTVDDCLRCRNELHIGMFFDGTGNNMDSDVPTLEHSNVVRMFRAFRPDDMDKGVFRVYLPGIGTPFRKIGDRGGKSEAAVALKGQQRLDWAFKQVEDIVKEARRHYSEIKLISLSVFGFSRGAALARAFLNLLVDPGEGHCSRTGDKLTWIDGKHPLQISFVGIWDTVAAVGVPIGANNVLYKRSELRGTTNAARESARIATLAGRLLSATADDLTALGLAFGPPGADPSPGPFDGHFAWGARMAIDHVPIKRGFHIIAGHEQRNSFPVDSVWRGQKMPPNTTEIVAPGMHSDVGGGYRPGEQGKGGPARAGQANAIQDSLKLSQITLNIMYHEALATGVPLRRIGAGDWLTDQKRDFLVDPDMYACYQHYMAHAKTDGMPLGDAMLRHMRLFFEWRLQHVYAQGRKADAEQVSKGEKVWSADEQALQAQKNELVARKSRLATERWSKEQVMSGRLYSPDPKRDREELAALDKQISDVDWQIVEIDQRINTLPSRSGFMDTVGQYDKELLADAESIHLSVKKDPSLRSRLRPHYRNLLEAYENERAGNGLKDARVIEFFDKYVHDSLAGFDTDFTLPSDPRVVYVGGNVKAKIAMDETQKAPGVGVGDPIPA